MSDHSYNTLYRKFNKYLNDCIDAHQMLDYQKLYSLISNIPDDIHNRITHSSWMPHFYSMLFTADDYRILYNTYVMFRYSYHVHRLTVQQINSVINGLIEHDSQSYKLFEIIDELNRSVSGYYTGVPKTVATKYLNSLPDVKKKELNDLRIQAGFHWPLFITSHGKYKL